MDSSNKTRLQVEALDDRVLPAVTFFSGVSGITMYDHLTGNTQVITPNQPYAIDEGRDGVVFASFDSGVWYYNGNNDRWGRLSPNPAQVISAAEDNTLVASFVGQGTFQFAQGNWRRLTRRPADQLATVQRNHVFASFDGFGTWEYVKGWTQLNEADALTMAASVDGSLFVGYDTGTYGYDGTDWDRLTRAIAIDLASATGDQVFGVFRSGLFAYNTTDGWNRLSYFQMEEITIDTESPLAASVSFLGLYEFDDVEGLARIGIENIDMLA
ncbi:MAG: hypothetical protein ACFCD0_30420 [Gemmataceae bacterium]